MQACLPIAVRVETFLASFSHPKKPSGWGRLVYKKEQSMSIVYSCYRQQAQTNRGERMVWIMRMNRLCCSYYRWIIWFADKIGALTTISKCSTNTISSSSNRNGEGKGVFPGHGVSPYESSNRFLIPDEKILITDEHIWLSVTLFIGANWIFKIAIQLMISMGWNGKQDYNKAAHSIWLNTWYA